MNRSEWGCDDSQLQYLSMGISGWLQTIHFFTNQDIATEVTRFEVYPICPENENVFSRIYEVDGRLVVRLYAYNIIQAAKRYGVYTKLMTMFLIAHEVAHIIYQTRLGSSASGAFLRMNPSEEKFCDKQAEHYMLNVYSYPAVEGISKMLQERQPVYEMQRQATIERLEKEKAPIEIAPF